MMWTRFTWLSVRSCEQDNGPLDSTKDRIS